MEFYEIIKNECELNIFIKTLPDLDGNEVYYGSLLWRSKYIENHKSMEFPLARFTASNKRSLINAIKKLEVKKGLYTLNNGEPVDEKGFVMYIKPYPVDEIMAMNNFTNEINTINSRKDVMARIKDFKTKQLLNKLSSEEISTNDYIKETIKIENDSVVKMMNSKSLYYSSFAKVSGRKVIIDVDIDVVKGREKPSIDEFYNFIIKCLDKKYLYGIIETRGGYHIQVKTKDMDKKTGRSWLGNLINSSNDIYKIEYESNNLLPVPGTVQGGFSPKIHLFTEDDKIYYSMILLEGLEDEIIVGSYPSFLEIKYPGYATTEDYKIISLNSTKQLKINK